MTCRELTDFLSDYLDGDLPTLTRDAFERHLAACSQCRDYLASFRATIALSRSAMKAGGAADDGPAAPAELPEALVKAILAARNSR